MRRINVFGLKRSGQHAIIEWIANHFNRPVMLSNNVLSWPCKTQKCTEVFHGKKHKNHDFAAVITTVEDPERKFALSHLPLEDETNVFILRSFWNNAASRMRLRDGHSAGWDSRFVEWWRSMAEFYLETPRLFVLYDKWNDNLEYRVALRVLFDLPHSMAASADAKSEVTAHRGYGGNIGSSFYKWGDRGEVDRRWELQYSANPRFRALVAECNEVRDLNMRIFGWTLDANGKEL